MIAAPLQITDGALRRTASVRSSIDCAISSLINTPLGTCMCDRDYGFGLGALRFEIINEKEGVVLNSSLPAGDGAAEGAPGAEYTKKISGNSKNLNTFAAELKAAIDRYEPRLRDTGVSMTYRREERKLYIVIRGLIVQAEGADPAKAKYEYTTSIKVWN